MTANCRCVFSVPVAALASVPLCSTLTLVPARVVPVRRPFHLDREPRSLAGPGGHGRGRPAGDAGAGTRRRGAGGWPGRVAGEPADDEHHDEGAGLREQRRGQSPAVEHDHRVPSLHGRATAQTRTWRYCSHHGLGCGFVLHDSGVDRRCRGRGLLLGRLGVAAPAAARSRPVATRRRLPPGTMRGGRSGLARWLLRSGVSRRGDLGRDLLAGRAVAAGRPVMARCSVLARCPMMAGGRGGVAGGGTGGPGGARRLARGGLAWGGAARPRGGALAGGGALAAYEAG